MSTITIRCPQPGNCDFPDDADFFRCQTCGAVRPPGDLTSARYYHNRAECLRRDARATGAETPPLARALDRAVNVWLAELDRELGQ